MEINKSVDKFSFTESYHDCVCDVQFLAKKQLTNIFLESQERYLANKERDCRAIELSCVRQIMMHYALSGSIKMHRLYIP